MVVATKGDMDGHHRRDAQLYHGDGSHHSGGGAVVGNLGQVAEQAFGQAAHLILRRGVLVDKIRLRSPPSCFETGVHLVGSHAVWNALRRWPGRMASG